MTTYFYNPIVQKSDDGTYSVDIYKYKMGKTVFDSYKSDKDYRTVLFYARFYVELMNNFEKNKFSLKKIFKN